MWLIPVKDRPHVLRGLIDAARETETPDAAVMVDCGPSQDEYRHMEWPANWRVHYAAAPLELVRAVNLLAEKYPGEAAYGVICDHARPKTPDWARILEGKAGNDGISYPDDGVMHGRWPQSSRFAKPGSPHITGCICLGGNLVRRMGWVMPPFLVHLCSDNVLETIALRLGVLRYMPDVLVERFIVNGEDRHSRRAAGGDFAAFGAWMESPATLPWIDSLA